MFPDIPADFAALTDEQIAAFIDASRAAIAALAAQPGSEIDAETLAAATAQTDAIESAVAVQAERTAADEATAATVAELAARAGATPEPEAEEVVEETTAEPAAEVVEETADEREPIAAAAAPAPRPLPARRPAAAPREQRAAPRGAIVAAAEGIGVPMGSEMPSLRAISEAMIRKHMATRNAEGASDVVIASIQGTYPEERVLRGDESPEATWAKIEAVTGEEALTASGGLCAPVQPYYDLAVVSVADRPVRDALAGFAATRGGIRFMAPPKLSAVTTGVGYLTAAQDATGGTTATKTCQTIPCPSQTEVDVAIVYHCLKFGNLGARVFPELVDQFTTLTMSAWARLAETKLLDGIAAASTAVTASQVAGAVSTLLGQIITAAAGMRSRHRMAKDAKLRCILPEWAVDLLLVDLIRGKFDRLGHDQSEMIAELGRHNVNVTVTLDGPTSGGQVFGTQSAGALLGFPTSIIWYLFPEGAFLYLDGGTLDLGIVRDSTLNSTNDFQVFGEGFENVAFIGVESLQVTSAICASGTVAADVSVTCPIA